MGATGIIGKNKHKQTWMSFFDKILAMSQVNVSSEEVGICGVKPDHFVPEKTVVNDENIPNNKQQEVTTATNVVTKLKMSLKGKEKADKGVNTQDTLSSSISVKAVTKEGSLPESFISKLKRMLQNNKKFEDDENYKKLKPTLYKSQLAEIFLKQYESQILEDGLSDDWEKALRREIKTIVRKFAAYLPRDVITINITQFLLAVLRSKRLEQITDEIENGLNSNFVRLVMDRDSCRNKTDYMICNQECQNEWIRLVKAMPLRNVVVYAVRKIPKKESTFSGDDLSILNFVSSSDEDDILAV